MWGTKEDAPLATATATASDISQLSQTWEEIGYMEAIAATQPMQPEEVEAIPTIHSKSVTAAPTKPKKEKGKKPRAEQSLTTPPPRKYQRAEDDADL